jgi:hypothetical protein
MTRSENPRLEEIPEHGSPRVTGHSESSRRAIEDASIEAIAERSNGDVE